MDYSELHPIQEKILKRLGYDAEKSFSEIRGDIESNKFAFHLKKLREKDLIEKTGEGYRISSHGKEILPYFDLEDVRHPVIVVDLLVFCGKKVFLIPKKEDPLDPFSGDYRAPSTRVGKKNKIKEKARGLFTDNFGETEDEITEGAIFDSEVIFLDGSRQHYILFFFKAEIDEIEDEDRWFTFDELKGLDVLPGLENVIRKIRWRDNLFMGEWDIKQGEESFEVEKLEL